MIEIKLEEASKLTLEMHIEGDIKTVAPEMRFSVLSEGVRMSFLGEQVSPGLYEVSFPKMIGKLDEGVYPVEVEIIVDGKHFAPLTETVHFTKELKPIVALKEVSKSPQTNIKIGTVRKVVETAPLRNIREFISSLPSTEIDTAYAIRCLDSFAANTPLKEGKLHIVPDSILKDNEAIALIRILLSRGNDLKEGKLVFENVKQMSQQVKAELRALLVEKGVSRKVLLQKGI